MENLKIAVVIPVFNTGIYLSECINSLLCQKYTNFEIFAINDGSTDDSALILENFKRLDKRIHVFHKINGGVSSARNLALDVIEDMDCFDVICYVDSDDIVKDNYLGQIVNLINIYDADCVFLGFCSFDRRGMPSIPYDQTSCKVLDSKLTPRFCFGIGEFDKKKYNSISMSIFNIGFSASIVKGIRFDESKKTAEDHDYLFRCLKYVKKAVACEQICYLYRIRKSSLTHTDLLRVNEINSYLKLIKEDKNINSDLRKVIEHMAFQVFWQTLRSSANLGKLKVLWPYFLSTLDEIERLFSSDIIKHKNAKKRIFIIRLGYFVTKLYFYLKRDKKLDEELRFAFC